MNHILLLRLAIRFFSQISLVLFLVVVGLSVGTMLQRFFLSQDQEIFLALVQNIKFLFSLLFFVTLCNFGNYISSSFCCAFFHLYIIVFSCDISSRAKNFSQGQKDFHPRARNFSNPWHRNLKRL